MSTKTSIRLEDLGEPVQRLLKSLKEYDEEDMVLLSWVSVKDMAKIYEDMAANRAAAMIWEELKVNLLKRREADDLKTKELDAKKNKIEEEIEKVNVQEPDEPSGASQEKDDEAKRQRKEEKKQKKLEKLRKEQEQLEAEAKEEKRRRKERKNALKEQKEKWNKYVTDHPLLFDPSKHSVIIEQDPVESLEPPPPTAATVKSIVNRMYTPQCPNCHAKYSKPPVRWECPMCLRKFNQKILTWQPDVPTCGCCTSSVGKFSRHHCRNCGRVTCNKCTSNKAMLPALEFEGPQRVCNQCLELLAPDAYAEIKAQAAEKKGVLSMLR